MPVEGRDGEVVPVTFLLQYFSYFPAERAAYLPEDAQVLVDRGLVEMVGEPPGVAAVLTGGVVDPVELEATLDVIVDGGFAITIDGTAREILPLDFTGLGAPNLAAALINAALGAIATCAWGVAGTNFTITTTATGATASISYAGPPAVGTDVSDICGLTEATGAVPQTQDPPPPPPHHRRRRTKA